MPDPRRASCRKCHRHKSVCGPISWTGQCLDCAKVAQAENIYGLGTMTGYPVGRWRRAVAASVGAVIPDDPPIGG